MPRYVRQWDDFSCGPIAILNALKWAGVRASIKRDYKRLLVLTKCSFPNGVCRFYLAPALYKNREFFVRRPRGATMRTVENHLRSGGVVLLSYGIYGDGKRRGHYTLLTRVSETGRSFTTINYYVGHTVCLIRRSSVVRDIRRRKMNGHWYPCVWLISKKVKKARA